MRLEIIIYNQLYHYFATCFHGFGIEFSQCSELPLSRNCKQRIGWPLSDATSTFYVEDNVLKPKVLSINATSFYLFRSHFCLPLYRWYGNLSIPRSIGTIELLELSPLNIWDHLSRIWFDPIKHVRDRCCTYLLGTRYQLRNDSFDCESDMVGWWKEWGGIITCPSVMNLDIGVGMICIYGLDYIID